ncbi:MULTISPECIES: hypothetical protein [unclassified Novosphingobium]|uniref:hypothetical protein n=1 Tax=unclassified Novosphingobium TaxID=2644732 RepID=UPI000D322CC9|nr:MULTISPECIES: hypothetical protein [unclassified Novosphingobium]PTR12617.1 hypothetical protein C8K11_10270 [Novosphingobium sp. GV055]PUB06401.1 hypothetical protein C8K12_10270 [Novosphingobium sp. GV061]PUB22452.1 hypothetical protein C8K14_10270 [Novosphingobium sp. GV079]PUB44477.1 hypothetical protein C8K10_10270 [Novosphingobium sp. GV027]
MERDSEPENSKVEAVVPAPHIRLRDYLWHPRIAKIWWSGSLAWWAGFALAQQTGWLLDFYETATSGYLNILFYPMTTAAVLGVPFVWAKLDRGDWVLITPTHEQMFPPRSVGGMRDPAADPLDPRSGLHWQWFHHRK